MREAAVPQRRCEVRGERVPCPAFMFTGSRCLSATPPSAANAAQQRALA